VLHDLLLRQGQGEEALMALPEPDALPPQRQPELTRRFAAQRQRVLQKPVLAALFAETLRRENKRDEAIETLRAAAEAAPRAQATPLWTELARSLQEAGRRDESRQILERLTSQGEDTTALYQSIEAWVQERLDRETQALRARLQRHPDATEAALDLAEHLLRMGEAKEATKVLGAATVGDDLRTRRGCLLARAHMDAGEMSLAEAVLRPLAALPNAGEEAVAAEIQFRLAECAEHTGRHAEAHARYLAVTDDPHFGVHARERARRSYARHLSEAAGEFRAVIERMSAL
jgi:thioredoxin-like negative regulator of GroEL